MSTSTSTSRMDPADLRPLPLLRLRRTRAQVDRTLLRRRMVRTVRTVLMVLMVPTVPTGRMARTTRPLLRASARSLRERTSARSSFVFKRCG